MKKIMLEITGPVTLRGRRPGEVFAVDAFDDGTPADIFWRKRLDDEARHGCGAVRVVPDATPPVAAEAAPAPAAKKGR